VCFINICYISGKYQIQTISSPHFLDLDHINGTMQVQVRKIKFIEILNT